MTVPKLTGGSMELEIKKLERAVCNLTNAVTALTTSINAQKINGNHRQPRESAPAVLNEPVQVPKAVCPETRCGAINSETVTCGHTLARYQSEYNCG
jgi:hypothetical protein